MTLHYTHEPVFKAASGDVENFIKEIFGKTFDINCDQGGDAPHGLIQVDVVDTGITLEEEGRLLLWKDSPPDDSYGDYLLETILSQLSEMGHMPAGKWYIRIE